MQQASFSIVIPTKNEEEQIGECVTACLQISSDVHVVDSESEDRTVAVAEECGAKVTTFSWNHDYPKKKQWCIDNLELNNDWILFVDADEVPTVELGLELARRINDPRVSAVLVPIRYIFLGKELRWGQRVWKLSLVHRKKVRFPEIDDLGLPGMGEQEGHYQPMVLKGRTVRSGIGLIHRDSDSVATWLRRHLRYAEWEAAVLQDKRLHTEVVQHKTIWGRLFHRLPFKPIGYFAFFYIFRLGFLDGKAGLHFALAHSWYYWSAQAIRADLNVETRTR